jgi:hypothetical protein
MGLFAEKQIGEQRQDQADHDHRGNRNKNEFFIAFDTNIARQFAEPAEESGHVSQGKPDDSYGDTDEGQQFSRRHRNTRRKSGMVNVWKNKTASNMHWLFLKKVSVILP